jgi:hypothetical protein
MMEKIPRRERQPALPTRSTVIRSARRLFAGSGLALLAIVVAIEPAAAQEFGGGEIDTLLQNLLAWVLRWAIVIGAIVAVIAHILAGWTSNPDKAFKRKEWRNRAFIGAAGAIPALLILNQIITAFGGSPIDFIPFV